MKTMTTLNYFVSFLFISLILWIKVFKKKSGRTSHNSQTHIRVLY